METSHETHLREERKKEKEFLFSTGFEKILPTYVKLQRKPNLAEFRRPLPTCVVLQRKRVLFRCLRCNLTQVGKGRQTRQGRVVPSGKIWEIPDIPEKSTRAKKTIARVLWCCGVPSTVSTYSVTTTCGNDMEPAEPAAAGRRSGTYAIQPKTPRERRKRAGGTAC